MHVFIAIPSGGHPHPLFLESLANLVFRAAIEGLPGPDGSLVRPRLTTKVEIGKLPMTRNRLLKLAMESGATHMLWLDDDHIFPDWALARLAKADCDIIGINQPTRFPPYLPTARAADGSRIYTTEADAKAGRIEQVGGIGFPMVLMRMGIVKKLEAAAKRDGGELFPLFNFSPSEDPLVNGGEDGFFCGRCEDAGVPIYIDHQLSWSVGHVGEIAVGMREALALRPEEKTPTMVPAAPQR